MNLDITKTELAVLMRGRVNRCIEKMDQLRKRVGEYEQKLFVDYDKCLGLGGSAVCQKAEDIIKVIDELRVEATNLWDVGQLMQQVQQNEGGKEKIIQGTTKDDPDEHPHAGEAAKGG